jgi:hypothetical protein
MLHMPHRRCFNTELTLTYSISVQFPTIAISHDSTMSCHIELCGDFSSNVDVKDLSFMTIFITFVDEISSNIEVLL